MKNTVTFLVLFSLATPAFCGGGPFFHLVEHFTWVLDQISTYHKEPIDDTPAQDKSQDQPSPRRVKRPISKTATFESLPQPVHLKFQGTTARASITANVTDYGNHFTVDVTTDQPANGWVVKYQSSRKEVLKGSLNSQYKFSFDCSEKFIRDFGLTVFVGDNSDLYPCFLQLY